MIEKGRKAFGNGVLPAKAVLTKRLLIAFCTYRKSIFLNLEKFILENLALEKGEGVGAIIPSDITPPPVFAALINDVLLTGTILSVEALKRFGKHVAICQFFLRYFRKNKYRIHFA